MRKVQVYLERLRLKIVVNFLYYIILLFFMIDFSNKTHIKIIVKTNSNKTEIKEYDETRESYRMDVKAQPIEGKANIEVIKYFKKKYKLNVEIISGQTSREKLLRIK